jgi:hypothetical protein
MFTKSPHNIAIPYFLFSSFYKSRIFTKKNSDKQSCVKLISKIKTFPFPIPTPFPTITDVDAILVQ